MTTKKVLVALALLLSATSASLAQGRHHHRALYDFAPGYSHQMHGVGGGDTGDLGIGSQR